jgi:quinol monooxygenase YgiN
MAKRKAKKSTSRKSKAKARPRKSGGASKGKLPKDAVTLAVILRAREGQAYLLEAELRALVGPTRKEEGCITYDLHRSIEPPSGFLLHEVWASREAHTAHTNTQHFLRWNARKDTLLASREAGFWKQVV